MLPKGLTESKLLTGAELAKLAMETKLPSEQDLRRHKEDTPEDEETLHRMIREKIKLGDVQGGLALAINFYID